MAPRRPRNSVKHLLSYLKSSDLKIFFFIFISSLITFELSSFSNPVFAAGVTGFVLSFLFHRYSSKIYCGAFIGMSSSLVLNNFFFILIASIIAGILFTHSHKIPVHGGKLGFIAFLSVLTISLPEMWKSNFYFTGEILPDIEFVMIIVVFSILALYLTYQMRLHFGKKFKHDSVIASAIIGVIFGSFALVFPHATPIAEASYAASFAGMGRLKLIEEKFLLVGVIVGVVYSLMLPFFRGFGGKLGTIAFLALIIVYIFLGKGRVKYLFE